MQKTNGFPLVAQEERSGARRKRCSPSVFLEGEDIMNGRRALASALVMGLTMATWPFVGVRISGAASPPVCQLASARSQIQHVIYIIFDNVHFRRDIPNVASDLEQMPNLLNFIRDNGVLLTNDHTILIAHTAGGILSSLTGLYPDRNGQTVTNSYGYFPPTGAPAFSTSFKYWTDLVDDATGTRDPLPNMVTDGQKNTPAPWVPYTRAGCDFGAVSTANVVLENTGTGPFGDMSEVFGTGSPEWNEAVASNAAPSGTAARARALTDFIGIAVHCGAGGGICVSNPTNIANARPDQLPDEPGGYLGFLGLFGAKYVNPAITGGQPAVNDTNGNPITDPFGQTGFPGFDGMSAAVSLGYVAQMQEAGIPVTYAYISDAHDNHTSAFPAPFNPNFPRSSGPGETDYQAQLAAYDEAFSIFFDRLARHGITKENTLFVFTEDEGDHFAGGISTDGAWSHTYCNVSTGQTCPANQIGEVNLNINSVLPSGYTPPPYSIHFDLAPTFYVSGNPARDDPALRQFERNVAAAQAIDPYLSSVPSPITVALADTVAEKALHMVNSDTQRTPTFTLFASQDYFIKTTNTNCPDSAHSAAVCIDYHFAWSHGGIQDEVNNIWVGLVGPGVRRMGEVGEVWTDHTDVRPTMISLLGLVDNYESDGRAVAEALFDWAVPQTLIAHRATLLRLGAVYKQLNAPFGNFGMSMLRASTIALSGGTSVDDSAYVAIENAIIGLTTRRDALASTIRHALHAAEFGGVPLDEQQAKGWIDDAQSLLDEAAGLAGP